jgi:hypothetical protein
MFLKEVDQLFRLGGKNVADRAVAPCRMVSVEVSRQDQPRGLVSFSGVSLNSGFYFF